MNSVAEQKRITLTEASLTYRVPMPTLRSWLDKRQLTKHRDDDGRIVLDVEQLETLLRKKGRLQ